MSDPVERLAAFARALRAEGLPVGPGRAAEFCRAASLLPPGELYWAGRATLVARHDEIPIYDRVFSSFFGASRSADRPHVRVQVEADVVVRGVARASRTEILRRKSFAELSPEEVAELAERSTGIALAVPMRRTRRRRTARRGTPDLRRTLRRSLRSGGEPLERLWLERRPRRRRLVLLIDVSRSMTDHTTALLMLTHAVLRRNRRWEAFCFGTRLTRITSVLATAAPADVLARAEEAVVDWDGGTRIGDSLKTFLDRYGHRGLARGAVIVVCSDGLEVGDPALLAEQMARLARLAHRVIWLNPLKASESYEPLARGMQAALPYVDAFASGHSPASLDVLAAVR